MVLHGDTREARLRVDSTSGSISSSIRVLTRAEERLTRVEEWMSRAEEWLTREEG
jgi:hypothetical protein